MIKKDYSVKRFLDYLKGPLDLKFVVVIILVALIIDMEISNESYFIDEFISGNLGVVIFILISFVYLVGQQYVLSYSQQKPFRTQLENSSFKRIQRSIKYMTLFVVIFFLTIIIQIISSGFYNSIFLLIILVVTNSIAIISMCNITIKFLSWYRSRRISSILIFGVMTCTIAITAVLTILFMGTILVGQPEKITSDYDVVFPKIEEGSSLSILNYLYYYLSIFTFVMTWLITSLLLKDYSVKLGNLRYWVILSLPLVFYLSQLSVAQFGLFIPKDQLDQYSFLMKYMFIYTLSSPIGGILFSLPFLLVVRKINTDNQLQNFLKISAYGILLYFASGSATVYQTPYPPFGLATVSVIGPSSYLISVGIYYSARLISRNRTLENQMRTSGKYSRFFASIGSAEMEKAMTEIIENIRKKLPPEREDIPEDPKFIDKEIFDFLKKYQSRKKSENSFNNNKH